MINPLFRPKQVLLHGTGRNGDEDGTLIENTAYCEPH